MTTLDVLAAVSFFVTGWCARDSFLRWRERRTRKRVGAELRAKGFTNARGEWVPPYDLCTPAEAAQHIQPSLRPPARFVRWVDELKRFVNRDDIRDA